MDQTTEWHSVSHLQTAAAAVVHIPPSQDVDVGLGSPPPTKGAGAEGTPRVVASEPRVIDEA